MEKPKKKTLGEWWSERTKNQKYLIIGGVVLLGVIGGLTNDTPSACDCIDNLDLGYYDALSKKDRDMRDKCNKAYAGRATLYIECKKEKGQ